MLKSRRQPARQDDDSVDRLKPQVTRPTSTPERDWGVETAMSDPKAPPSAMNIHDSLSWQCLTPQPGHHFFGYYDRCAWNHDNTRHLCLRVGQCERLPVTGETAEIGYVGREGEGFVKLAETRAWCHQQGAMTLWLKHKPDAFIYNDYDVAARRLLARIFELGKGVTGSYARPIYAMSPDGRWGVSLNFSRIPRRGYSYADAVLSGQNHPDLDADGIFLVDLHSGESRLIVSYRRMIALHPVPYELGDQYWWLNHAIFNCDSSKLLFLFRHCRDPHRPSPWKTHMYTVDLGGENLACPLPHFYWSGTISHQIWGRSPHEVLLDANWRGRGADYVVFDERQLPLRATLISEGLGAMGHLVFSPDGEWMLADTYPRDGMQTLALVNVGTGDCRVVGRFRHEQPEGSPVDVRCDLHPRWSADGALITVDSIHDGERRVYMLEAAPAQRQ